MNVCSFVALMFALAAAGEAWAQSAQPVPAPQTVPPFVIQTDNGDNQIQVGLLIQMDGRFAVADSQGNVLDTFLLRRVRPILQGRIARVFEFYVNPDFAGGAVNLRDMYFDTRFSDAFRIRVGKAKAPFGIERLHGAAGLLFVERALPTTVVPDRDIGVQVLGDVAGGVFSYQGALMNGVVDGGTQDLDTNTAKDLVGRIVVRPWRRNRRHPLAGLGVALAGSHGLQPTALPVFRTAGFQTFFSYSGAVGEGDRRRVSPQAFYYRGPFGGFGEYVRSTGAIRKESVAAGIDHTAWQVAASWVLTGEPATDRGVARPNVPFDPATGGWGALQIAIRYNQLAVDREAVTLGFAAPDASRKAQAIAVGANWYLNPFIKWVLNAERTVFDGDADGPRQPENAVLLRTQIAF
jgi:phosphate-selective porin OprO and OprP